MNYKEYKDLNSLANVKYNTHNTLTLAETPAAYISFDLIDSPVQMTVQIRVIYREFARLRNKLAYLRIVDILLA